MARLERQTIRQLRALLRQGLILALLLKTGTTYGALECSAIHISVSQRVQVADLHSFAKAMTEGMLVRPEQGDLFEIYKNVFLTDPNVTVQGGHTLTSVVEILTKHPELEKRHFREYDISRTEKIYDAPESLLKYIKSQIQTAGQVRSNLLQIEANTGYWKKILNYQEITMPSNLDKIQQKIFQRTSNERFERYLSRIISKTNRDLLADLKGDSKNFEQKAKSLFATLKLVQEWMEKNKRDTTNIRQAMVDLIHTVGFGNEATQLLLKSKNALEQLDGLKKVLEERDRIASEMGYRDGFQDLQKKLRVGFPRGFSKNENPYVDIHRFESLVLAGKPKLRKSETIRIRSLSIQESPFRSCTGGGDCATNTYFAKALDPNFYYFTMTDSQHHSTGQMAIVLGEAKNPSTGLLEKIAFIDKVQNIPNSLLPSFLNAVAMSIGEQGYKLGIAEDVGNHNGLSITKSLGEYFQYEVLPRLSQKLVQFSPHTNQYHFEAGYSRAYDHLDLKVYRPMALEENSEITRGREYQSFSYNESLSKDNLIEELLKLKNSSDPDGVARFVSIGPALQNLEKLGFISKKEFETDLKDILSRPNLPFSVRKRAAYEILLIKTLPSLEEIGSTLGNFSDLEKAQISSEIRQWPKSSDRRKINFTRYLNYVWFAAISDADIKTLETLAETKLFDENSKNENGYSTLLVALQYNKRQVIEWLLERKNLRLSIKDELGYSDLERARLLDRNELVDFIESKRPGLHSRKLPSIDRNTDGSPIIAFAHITPGRFKMGNYEKVDVTLTKGFEFLSIKTTDNMWNSVIELSKKYQAQTISRIPEPVHSNGELLPVYKGNYDDVEIWIEALNALSRQNNSQLQKELANLFPGHQQNDTYRLPTSAEWEYVARIKGLSTGEFYFTHSLRNPKEMDDFAWHSGNSDGTVHAVGLKKPLLIDGQPIYDLHGNGREWTSNWYWHGNLVGGVDPMGPPTGIAHVQRGGSTRENPVFSHSGLEAFGETSNVGFRLVRIRP